jgi:YfiH family protein
VAIAKLRSKPKTRRTPGESLSTKPIWHSFKSDGLQIIRLKPFERFDWLVHGFSTRLGGESLLENSSGSPQRPQKVLNLGLTDWDSPERVESNRRRFVGALCKKESSLITLRQIHSDVVHSVKSEAAGSLTGDALITSNRGLLLAVQTADCIPILLVDPRHRAVAAVHAGWRGTVARIAAKTVGRMQMEFATRPADLLAALGPGIHQCCYEVGPDVIKEFAAQFPNARDWFDGPFDVLASGEDPNPLPWLSMMPPGHEPPPPRCYLDLYTSNATILAEAGLKPKNIFCSDLCTSCRTDLLFSYRRECRTGRLMAVIGIA